MKINADLTKPARVETTSLPWIPSPLAGVERRMIERDGDEVARVTSIVRYAPGSHFSEHTHTGGEEFLVLDGIFSDQYGDFPAGTYVRNPIGSSHAPHSDGGTVILVKLWWMHADDQDFTRIDTTRADLWQPGEDPGTEIMALHEFGPEQTFLLRLTAGASVPEQNLPGGEEFFVAEGSCENETGTCSKGGWVRTPPGAANSLFSRDGCTLFMKRGHLLNPPPGPA